ncbi:alpha/beta fold hydrolase [Streptomyces sp. TLI_171]|uniref:alpha/beta fold hydrolase n=1 Tax=Streptomyces sp. TLI_171 TaxID=1938859 RepID=UPI000C1A029D|nr:alpha/beta hydrolase [Streptomyces sp. TLI_171]RKE19205.1 pimeloyl-ACP methyl ester carboxylesterase [Streptomyces sp. TLI_171]
MTSPQTLTVPVDGGELAVLHWPATAPGAPVVVAVHGITANALAWGALAGLLAGRVALYAPDLRGRAASRDLPGPYGLARHAEDVAALITALDAGPVRLVGHSMGAWVGAVTAARHPALVRELTLVDGAVSFPLPPGVREEDALAAVLGPALTRLSMTFESRAAYRAFWQAHPAFDPWTEDLDAYTQRDLVGAEPELVSSCVHEAITTDGTQVLLDQEAAGAIHGLTVPARLLYAERGLMDEPQALYDEERLTAAKVTVPTERVADTNHYSIIRSERLVELLS